MLVWDIESDGLLEDITRIHCICAKDTVTGKEFKFRPNAIGDGLKLIEGYLKNGEDIGGHNIIDFDIPAILKLYPKFKCYRKHRPQIKDSLVMSQTIYSNVATYDYALLRKGHIPRNLVGSHSLKAWGYRLNNNKGTYGEETDNAWGAFSEEMLTYCMQDVNLNCDVFAKMETNRYPEGPLKLEHDAQWLMSQMQRNGFPFDHDKAVALMQLLMAKEAEERQKVIAYMPEIPNKVDKVTGEPIPFIPKRDNKRLGYKEGVPVFKMKDFNPSSRQQVGWLLKHHYKYMPLNEELYNEDDVKECVDVEDINELGKCRLSMGADTFKFIINDETAPKEVRELASILAPFFVVTKTAGQVYKGKESWMHHYNERTGCIHGKVYANGTVSTRASHSSPNLAQIPAVRAEFGKECREMFNPNYQNNGWVQVGVDASGLELRCLAHYMANYDKGAYGDIIMNGDIHSANQKAAGLPTRDNAKTFIYAFLYGAGDAKIGRIVGKDAAEGKRLKKAFLEQTPAIKQLREAVQDTLVEMHHGRVKRWKRKYLKSLDGRPLWVRAPHSALNLLLQSCGALVCKKWIILLEEKLLEKGYKHGWDGDFAYMMWVHDEVQISCRTREIAEDVLETAQQAMRETGEFFNFRMPLDTEGKIGTSWADCH